MGEHRKSSPAYARVEQPFGAKPPVIHCPICGQATLDDGYITPCKHLAFSYVGVNGEFEYQSVDFENRFSQMDIGELSFDGFPELLKQAGYGNHLLAIEITHGGMACGPVWYTDVIGFDYQSVVD
jgi:hypothetical protein